MTSTVQAGSESVLTAKSIFADLRRSLECTPQRRCGGMVDATDLKFTKERFLSQHLVTLNCINYLGKSRFFGCFHGPGTKIRRVGRAHKRQGARTAAYIDWTWPFP